MGGFVCTSNSCSGNLQPHRLLSLLLLLLLSATCHLPKPARAQTACYTAAPWFRRTRTNLTRYASFFGTSFRVTLAANASDCKKIVGEVKCNQSAPANFFVFSETGQFRNNNANVGNCAYGDSCQPLPAGMANVTTGVMTPVTCPGPPPPPLAPVFCPGNGWPRRDVFLNRTLTVYNFLGSAVDLVDAANVTDCQRQAQASRCSGSGYSHYVFMRRGFNDPVIGSIGNCAFGNGCASLTPGYTPAVFGKLTAACATS